PEGDVAVLHLLVGRMQAREALVAVDRLDVVAARELRVRDSQLSQYRELREGILLFDELEVLLCFRKVFVLQLGESLLVILFGRERVSDRLGLFIRGGASDRNRRRQGEGGDQRQRRP